MSDLLDLALIAAFTGRRNGQDVGCQSVPMDLRYRDLIIRHLIGSGAVHTGQSSASGGSCDSA